MQKKLFEKLPALVASVAMAGALAFTSRAAAGQNCVPRQYQG